MKMLCEACIPCDAVAVGCNALLAFSPSSSNGAKGAGGGNVVGAGASCNALDASSSSSGGGSDYSNIHVPQQYTSRELLRTDEPLEVEFPINVTVFASSNMAMIGA